MSPLISVILPHYNRPSFLKRSLGSVLRQSYPHIEVIVIDDGSHCDPRDEIFSIANKDTRVSYRRVKHGGVSHARNRGLTLAKGKWICFLDSDDEWMVDKLEKQLAYTVQGNWVISQTDDIWIRKNKRVNPSNIHLKKEGDIFDLSLKRCMVSMSAVMIHASLFAKYGVFDTHLPVCEDYDLFLRILKDHPVGFLAEKLILRYAGHGGQLSNQYEGMDRFRIRSIRKLLKSHLSKDKRAAAIREACAKCRIVATGAKKRKKYARYAKYRFLEWLIQKFHGFV